jgi:exodeoxyribonuclease X
MHDAVVTYSILTKLLEHATMEQLIEWTEQPAKLPKMPMGKHFGQAWDTIPAPYLEWCLKQADMREDVKHAAKEELTRRRTNATGRSG